MHIDVSRALSQSASPLIVLTLVLTTIVGAVAAHRLERGSRKPVTIEIRALLARIHGALDSLHRQSDDTSYPLEEVLQGINARQQPPVVTTLAPPMVVADKLQPIAPPPYDSVLRVAGIISNPECALACVNNHILGVGGIVEGFKIIKIEPNQVTFDNQQGRIQVIKFR